MRISDWSSDVCSSDLRGERRERAAEFSDGGPDGRDDRYAAQFHKYWLPGFYGVVVQIARSSWPAAARKSGRYRSMRYSALCAAEKVATLSAATVAPLRSRTGTASERRPSSSSSSTRLQRCSATQASSAPSAGLATSGRSVRRSSAAAASHAARPGSSAAASQIGRAHV